MRKLRKIRRVSLAVGAALALSVFTLAGTASAKPVPTGPPVPGGVNGPNGAAFRPPPPGKTTPKPNQAVPYETSPNSPLIRPKSPATKLPKGATPPSAGTMAAAAQPAVRPLLNTACAGYAIFTFDDGPDTQSTQPLLDLMNQLNLKGYFFVVGVAVQGSAGNQLVRNEVASGDILGDHTWDHQSFTGYSTGTAPLTQSQIDSEISQTQNLITSLGLPAPTVYRPPYGDINATDDAYIRNTYGLQVVMPWQNGSDAAVGGVIADSRDWEGVSTDQIVQNVTVGYTSASGRFYPGMAQSTPDKPAILAFHDTTGAALQNALQPIVDWMNANHFCSTLTMRPDATGGVVPTQAQSEPASGLVVNPSVETDWPAGNAGGFPTSWPAGWMTAGWGNRTATFGTTTDAHTGQQAVTTSISNWTTGTADWLIVQRGSGTSSSNTYTPLAQPGHTYTFWVWYKGTWSGNAGIVAYYRDASNNWVYWTSGLAMPTSPGVWNLAWYTSPPLPAGATAVSFGMSLGGNGSITTDDYQMIANL